MKNFTPTILSFLALGAVFSGCNAPTGTVPDTAVPVSSTTGGGTSNNPQPSTQNPPAPAPTQRPAPVPVKPPTPAPAPLPAPTGTPIALVYGGPGVLTGYDDTLAMAKSVASQAGFKVIVVTQPVDAATLNSASVWVQPGGPNLSADSYMNANGMADQVRDFVNRGGGYVGFCGGAFSAVNNLGLIHGNAWNLDLPTGKVPVNWLGNTRFIHFEHGPYIQLSDKNAEIVGTYADGSTAVARSHYGKGEVFISGVHPEANTDWPPSYDPDGSDQYLAIGMIREVAARPEVL